jgi:DNA processing protein
LIPADTLAWLRLSLIPGMGPIARRDLVERFGSPQAVLAASADELRAFAGNATTAAIAKGVDTTLLERTQRWLEIPGRAIITVADAAYPAMLRQIADPPTVLYAEGNTGLLQRPCLAIVGARNCSAGGALDARDFARALSDAGICIVSGLAMGIDAAAHAGALAGSSASIAIMGTGADVLYPPRNATIGALLRERGCVVTEFPLGTQPLRGNFPRRNRIISGLARGVLVVEANRQSGSLLTAKSALEQDREVFALPGSIHSPLAKGCHLLIKEGAKLVEDIDDILVELGFAPTASSHQSQRRDTACDPLMRAIEFDPLSPDQIARRTGLDMASIGARLARLLIDGEIEAVAGGKFQRAEQATTKRLL